MHLLTCSLNLFPYRNPIKTSTSVQYSIKMSSWVCSKCTYLNPPSQKSTCQICLSTSTTSTSTSSPSSPPPPPPRSSSPSKWSCKACTFANSYGRTDCEICGTKANASFLSAFEELDSITSNQELDSSIGSVFFPLRACKRKSEDDTPTTPAAESSDGFREVGMFRGVKLSRKAETLLEEVKPNASLGSLKILSYNVWFREDLEMHKRMKAIGDLVEQHTPDIICFQEVTPNIYELFQQFKWWKAYNCSVSPEMSITRPYFCMQLSKVPVMSFNSKPFSNSIMGRELCTTKVEFEKGKMLVVATSHLESPCPGPPKWDQMYSKERVAQAKEALNILDDSPNAIFAGDMNWDDKLDGQIPLRDGWVDAWSELRPGEIGFTYDTKSNKMLSGNRTLQKRLDRFLCNFQDFKISGIDMIGTDAIPGLSYCKEKKVRNEVKKLVLPVLPSDHYGLLLTICKK